MRFIDEVRAERNGRTIPLAQFMEDYKKYSDNTCYGFVEGKDDPSYYRNKINSQLPLGCKIILYPSNGKDNVKYIYDQIKTRCYPENRICYFMDRDLSLFINDPYLIINPKVYVTDKYAIENDILNSETFLSTLQDLLGFSSLQYDDVEKIVQRFESQKMKFERIMLPVMANIIMWKRKSIKTANYKNFRIKDIISVKNGYIEQKIPSEEIIKLLYRQSGVDLDIYDVEIVNNIINEITDKNLISDVLRGKYLSIFFILFCNSIYNDCVALGLSKVNKGRTLNDNDIMECIAPRSRIPDSLKLFIKLNIKKYFEDLCQNTH